MVCLTFKNTYMALFREVTLQFGLAHTDTPKLTQ
jgi:hypothetical protein